MRVGPIVMLLAAVIASTAQALPQAQDRVYTGDQNSNTVSVFDPSTNTLLGQIRLGNPRPDVLSPLYKGQINVHGLGYSPDHKTIIAISTNSNSVTFIDTETNKVKGVTYIGRSPHEGFFTPDGKEAWVTVRGEDYLSVLDAVTMKETSRIKTTTGPGMIAFDGPRNRAYVCNSFNPVFEVFDLTTHKLIRSLPVVSPFCPNLWVSPDGSEVWQTHKDIGKVTRIDLDSLTVLGTIDTGLITNHVNFIRAAGGMRAYVTIGGENVVKVFTVDKAPTLVATIPVGSLPHGIWPSDDGSRIYVGLENGDAIAVIDTETEKVVTTVPIGEAPQALIYVSGAVSKGDGRANLAARPDGPQSRGIKLQTRTGDAGGYVVWRNVGLVDLIEADIFKLKPQTLYSLYINGKQPAAMLLRTNEHGMGVQTIIGPTRDVVPAGLTQGNAPDHLSMIIMEGEAKPDAKDAVLTGDQI